MDAAAPPAAAAAAAAAAGGEAARLRLLAYERELLDDVLGEEGGEEGASTSGAGGGARAGGGGGALCILAAGLGWQKILAVLLRLHEFQRPGPVLVVGATPRQRALLARELRRHDAAAALPTDVTADVPAPERLALYRSTACCFVTTRILVVDLLCGRAQPKAIAGLLVLNAHRVGENTGEGFAIRLYRAGGGAGFVRCASTRPACSRAVALGSGVAGGGGGASPGRASDALRRRRFRRRRPPCKPRRAFSDAPAEFASGFSRVEKVMRALRVRRLCLWPRFQAGVQDALRSRPPELVEWEQDLSGAMARIQARARACAGGGRGVRGFAASAACGKEGCCVEGERCPLRPATPPSNRCAPATQNKTLTKRQEAIAEVLAACVKELRRTNRIDCGDWNLDEALFRSFDRQARARGGGGRGRRPGGTAGAHWEPPPPIGPYAGPSFPPPPNPPPNR